MWEGRFKSSLVDKEAYCLACYRYIELSPVRAGMVRHPANYRWSSFNFNALGEASDLRVPHNCWFALGKFKQQIVIGVASLGSDPIYSFFSAFQPCLIPA